MSLNIRSDDIRHEFQTAGLTYYLPMLKLRLWLEHNFKFLKSLRTIIIFRYSETYYIFQIAGWTLQRLLVVSYKFPKSCLFQRRLKFPFTWRSGFKCNFPLRLNQAFEVSLNCLFFGSCLVRLLTSVLSCLVLMYSTV